MSERTTGATDEQIAAAAKRADDSWGYGEGMPHILGPEVRGAAPFLIPEGYVIARAADVLTADQRDSVIRALNFIVVNEELFSGEHSMNQWADDVETLRAIVNGGTDDQ